MEFLGDFHLHSRFSRATSRELSLPHLQAWALRKGIAVVGTGDLTHPEWLAEMREQLVPAGDGVYRLRDDLARRADVAVARHGAGPAVRFLLTGEISNIYKQDGKTRKIHTVVFAPDLEAAARLQASLERVGNIRSDGRPILGITARELLEIVLETDERAFVVPAHIWTPWFSLLGSRSGFDSLEECYGDLAGRIFALETGLSADPLMCRRLSSLDGRVLVSNSDAHSGPKLGREANLFDTEPDFPSIRAAWESGDRSRFLGTVEFHPEEGKYHFDGHRKCAVRLSPRESRARGGVCPACGKPLTRGVLSRVEDLADRDPEAAPRDPYRMLVPLAEVLGEVLAVGAGSKGVRRLYDELLARLGPELEILRRVPLAAIEEASRPLVAEAIRRVRRGELHVEPGYDGEFGIVRIFAPSERARLAGQGSLFAPAAIAENPSPPPPPPPAPPPSLTPVPAASRAGEAPAAAVPSAAPGGPLDEAQQAAVDAPAGPLLIVAGPGTGKTRTLTHRIARRVLSGDVPPGEVLAVTFTNRAAAEMRERLRRLLGPAPCERITIGTFHALGLAILRAETGAAGLAPGFRVIDEEERAGLVALALAPEGEEEGEASHARAAAARRDLDTGGCLPPAPAGETSPLRARYDEIKASRNVVDFDDLVRLPLALFARRPDVAARWARRYRFVCVDEYQDLNPAQYALVRALLPPGGGDLTAIGDPHQAIYAFRGADARFFQRFEHDFPRARVLRLERSYRSTECIVAGATQVLAASQGGGGGGDEILWSGIRGPEWIEIRPAPTARAEAETVVAEIERLVGGVREFSIDSGRVDSAAAGRGFSFSDIAVLYRLRALRAPLVEALERAGLPYQTADHHAALGEPGVREIEGRLRGMRGDPGLPVAERVAAAAGEGPWRDPLVELARGFGTDLEAFLDHLALGRGVDLLAPRGERIRLLTLHASKGLEFPVVFLVGCEEGVLPWTGPPGETDPADPEEERRLLYVGMTRARTLLIVTHARKRVLFGRRTPGRPSPFLKDIEQALRATRDPAAGGRRSPPPADRQPTLF